MYFIFHKYKNVIVNGIILIALAIASFAPESNLRDGFLGVAFGASFVNFLISLGDVKSRKDKIQVNNLPQDQN